MKHLAKNALCALYKYSGFLRAQEALARWAGRPFLSILLLHRVTDLIPPDGLTVGEEFFRGLCRMLRQRFHVVSLAEVFRLLKTGESPPPRTVAITFDDCYQDNLAAARVLAEHGLPACFFLPTSFVQTSKRFPWDAHLPPLANLTWDEVRTIAALGHDIGSHTATHPDLGKLGPDANRYELLQSKRELEAQLQRPARWFAIPFGGPSSFQPEHLPLLCEAGYEGCLSAMTGFVYQNMHRRILPRIPVPAFSSLLRLEVHLTGCLDWFHGIKRRASLLAT